LKQTLLLIVATLGCTAPALAQSGGRADLHDVLKTQFRGERTDPGARYAAAFADLDGDGRPEAIVYLMSRGYCGTGGCSVFIYRATGRSWWRIARMTVSHLPIRVLNTRTHGWRDLAVSQRELRGEHFVRYEARLRFNGRTYPLNPSVPPAEQLSRRVPGQILIGENDRGRPLF
jgi:hypothetical protein